MKNRHHKHIFKKSYSPLIQNSFVKNNSNMIFGKIFRFLFKKITLEVESRNTLQNRNYFQNSVFLSFQSTNTSLLLFLNLLRKNKIKLPVVSLGFTPYLFQRISIITKKIIYFLSKIISNSECGFISDNDFLTKTLNNNDSLIISLTSKKQFKNRYIKKNKDNLEVLIDLQNEMNEAIYIYPQMIFWNRNPERSRTLVSSKATGDRKLLSALFTIFKSITDPFIRISDPINLKLFIKEFNECNSTEISIHLRKALFDIYYNEKRTILGPILKSRQEIMEKVLDHDNVLSAIKENSTHDKEILKLRKNAYSYFKEITADFSIIYVKYFSKTLFYIFKKIFDGIVYDETVFEKIRKISSGNPLVLVPCHKSHIDYLIVSSLFYRHKLIPPHVVAGTNLNFFPAGKVLRRSGAFFMRRSFKENIIYSTVFKQYIKTIASENYTLEFFIEGGRSRTGKTMTPKMGILKYLIEAKNEGYCKDITILPVSINYDRILEETSYQSEVGGKKKSNETTSSFFKSLSLLKKNFGKVYLSFNEPISYNEISKNSDNQIEILNNLGETIIDTINNNIIVTSYSLISTILLLSTSKGFSKNSILIKLRYMIKYLNSVEIKIVDELDNENNHPLIIDKVLHSFMQDNIISNLTYAKEENILYYKSEESLYVLHHEYRNRISYYKNSVIHHFLAISFTSAAILSLNKHEGITLNSIIDRVKVYSDLLSMEFVSLSNLDIEESVLNSLEFLSKESVLIKKENSYHISNNDGAALTYFSKIIEDYIESYYTVLYTLQKIRKSKTEERKLLDTIKSNGIKLYHLCEIDHPESISTMNYKNAVEKLNSMGLINIIRTEKNKNLCANINTEKISIYITLVKSLLRNQMPSFFSPTNPLKSTSTINGISSVRG